MDKILIDPALPELASFSPEASFQTGLSFSRLEQQITSLDSAIQNGVKHVLCTTGSPLFQVFMDHPGRWPFSLAAVVPNFQQFVRDTSHFGTIGAALMRVKKMSLFQMMRMGLFCAGYILQVLQMKFEILMNTFLMAEMSQLFKTKKLKIDQVFLHPQMTDLALALGRSDFFPLYVKVVRTWGSTPGFMTRNFAPLESLLKRTGVQASLMAPFNPKGYGMNPSREECEKAREALSSNPQIPVFGFHWNLPGVGTEESLAYATRLKLNGIAVGLDSFL